MRANDFTTESAVEDLKNKLPSLKNTSYDTIDELMQKISRRYKLTGKKLHDLFVHKYGHTPDTWIKKIKNRLGEEDITESEHAHYRNYSTSDLLRMIKTIKRDEIGLKIITSITNEIMRRKQGMSEGPKEVIGLAKFAIGGGIPGGQRPADILGEKNVAEGLPQTLRKFVPGYAKREIDKKMDAEKFGRTDVDRDANYYRYKKIQDKIKEQGVAEGSEEGNLYAMALQKYPQLKRVDRETVINALNNAYEDYLMHYGYEGIGPEEESSMIDHVVKGLKQGVAEGLSEDVQGPDEVQQIKDFIKWSMKTLNVKTKPKFTLSKNTEQAQAGHHTGAHSGDRIWVYIGNRNLIDIFRTIFHELVHQRQSELNMIKDGDSYPGSPIEAMADMMAGKYIKIYGKEHPEIFQ